MSAGRSAWFVMACVLLAACAAQYRAAPFPGAGGYTDRQLEPLVFEVSYLSARTVEASALEPLALYRAAELCLERGFDRFAVVRRLAKSSTEPRNAWAHVALVVRLGGSSDPAHATFDARNTLERLGPRVRGPA
jgi:hypothetical protein